VNAEIGRQQAGKKGEIGFFGPGRERKKKKREIEPGEIATDSLIVPPP
jgi:hypothetical protein